MFEVSYQGWAPKVLHYFFSSIQANIQVNIHVIRVEVMDEILADDDDDD